MIDRIKASSENGLTTLKHELNFHANLLFLLLLKDFLMESYHRYAVEFTRCGKLWLFIKLKCFFKRLHFRRLACGVIE